MSFYASNSLYSMLYIIVLCICSLVSNMVDSEVINVGGDRWDDSTNYVSWAQQYNFTVGDVLVFSYAPGTHNVYQVTKATYQSCDTSTGVDARYNSGDDQIVLKEAKPYWFICTVERHCQLGMKLAINVTGSATRNVTGSATRPTTISPSIQPDNSESSSPRRHVTSKFFVAGVGFLSILTIFC